MKTNIIYCGDCKDVLKRYVPDKSVDLIYGDPPFFSQKNYESFWLKDSITKTGFSDSEWESFRATIDPVVMAEFDHMEERWKGGKKGIYVYIAYMKERLVQCERVLKDTGTIYLHCDWHAGHYLKVMMDQVFGYESFRNEIAWCYAGGGIPREDFPRKHDTIFRYCKGDAFFDPPMRKYSQTGSGRHSDGSTYDLDDDRTPINDWWTDIAPLNTQAKEKLGWPTQKPESLLERIITASSKKGDIVLDPFCGCGTALAVAQKQGRKFIGIDISRTGCDVTRTRLGGSVQVIGGETLAELKVMDPHDFARLIIQEKLGGVVNPKKSGDMGIDGWIDFKTVPVQVKRWGHKVGRPEVDKFRTAVARDGKKSGIMVGFNFSRDAYAEAKRSVDGDVISINLMKVADIMKNNYTVTNASVRIPFEDLEQADTGQEEE